MQNVPLWHENKKNLFKWFYFLPTGQTKLSTTLVFRYWHGAASWFWNIITKCIIKSKFTKSILDINLTSLRVFLFKNVKGSLKEMSRLYKYTTFYLYSTLVLGDNFMSRDPNPFIFGDMAPFVLSFVGSSPDLVVFWWVGYEFDFL